MANFDNFLASTDALEPESSASSAVTVSPTAVLDAVALGVARSFVSKDCTNRIGELAVGRTFFSSLISDATISYLVLLNQPGEAYHYIFKHMFNLDFVFTLHPSQLINRSLNLNF